MEQQQQKPQSDFDKARHALRLMQAALEKAKTTHGDLYTFGDCASIYTAMININNFIDKLEQSQTTSYSKQASMPIVSYQTN